MNATNDRRDAMAASGPVKAHRLRRAPRFLAATQKALLIAVQIAVLWFICLGASATVSRLHVPLPGNALGLIILFALLCSGIVKASWLEPAASLLIKHLAFFFIPITVGLLDMGHLFARYGVGILVTLTISAAAGMAVCGLTVQCLIDAQNRRLALRRRR